MSRDAFVQNVILNVSADLDGLDLQSRESFDQLARDKIRRQYEHVCPLRDKHMHEFKSGNDGARGAREACKDVGIASTFQIVRISALVTASQGELRVNSNCCP